jgi:hypothetical protein
MLSSNDYRLWTKSAVVERLWITWPECQRHLFYYPGDLRALDRADTGCLDGGPT